MSRWSQYSYSVELFGPVRSLWNHDNGPRARKKKESKIHAHEFFKTSFRNVNESLAI